MTQERTTTPTGTAVWRRLEGAISATAREIRQTYDHSLAHLKLNLPEATLVAYVADNGPLTQTEIATGLHSGRAIIGQRIDAMERAGLLRRDPDPDDRRVWIVSVTLNGQLISERINTADRWLRDALRSGISADDRRIFVDVLLKLQANLSTLREEPLPHQSE